MDFSFFFEAGRFATPEDVERMLHGDGVEMAMRVDNILAASDRFVAQARAEKSHV